MVIIWGIEVLKRAPPYAKKLAPINVAM